MTQKFLDYYQAFEVIKQNYPRSLEILERMKEYFSELGEKLNSVHAKIEETQKAYEEVNGKPIKVSNLPGSSWCKLEEPLNISSLFEFMAMDVKLSLDKNLQNFIVEYKKEYSDLIKETESKFKVQKEKEKAAKEAHEAYMKLGNEVQSAYDNNQMDKLPQLREAFVKAQNAAVDAYNNLNGRTLITCSSFEQTLSNFERLERKRIETLKSLYGDLISRINTISDFYDAKAGVIQALNGAFDPSGEAEKLKSMVFMKDSIANPLFQPLHVPGKITKYLDLQHVFKNEIAKGGKIAIATDDFMGNESQLAVAKDEYLVTMSEEDDGFICKNINDMVGSVPKSILSFIE